MKTNSELEIEYHFKEGIFPDLIIVIHRLDGKIVSKREYKMIKNEKK